jgi:hypothetical protein
MCEVGGGGEVGGRWWEERKGEGEKRRKRDAMVN